MLRGGVEEGQGGGAITKLNKTVQSHHTVYLFLTLFDKAYAAPSLTRLKGLMHQSIVNAIALRSMILHSYLERNV